ncbi:hypothetical protein [uncultured Clostridium sp.]|uniref:hypothetical protein n=1 Tax=uncultured Clostridium sp. TaxID=59620 RepID=UPI0025E3603B|nr:hypothetical protein [uncultured Clostridium sp.]MDU4882678.1 hypothetical protein [Clostridium celatum]MDU7076053.1 hypothetical protein [Clostridium celatum]
MAKQQISISFKNNTKESEMFRIINRIEDKAGEIKPVLYKYFVLGYRFAEENESAGSINIQSNNQVEEDEDDGVDVTDF